MLQLITVAVINIFLETLSVKNRIILKPVFLYEFFLKGISE